MDAVLQSSLVCYLDDIIVMVHGGPLPTLWTRQFAVTWTVAREVHLTANT